MCFCSVICRWSVTMHGTTRWDSCQSSLLCATPASRPSTTRPSSDATDAAAAKPHLASVKLRHCCCELVQRSSWTQVEFVRYFRWRLLRCMVPWKKSVSIVYTQPDRILSRRSECQHLGRVPAQLSRARLAGKDNKMLFFNYIIYRAFNYCQDILSSFTLCVDKTI